MKIDFNKLLFVVIISFLQIFIIASCKGQSNEYFNKAIDVLKKPDYKQALYYLNKSLSSSDDKYDSLLYNKILIKRAEIYLQQNQIKYAKKDLDIAINLLINQTDDSSSFYLIKAYSSLGNLNVSTGDIEEANKYYKKGEVLINKFFSDNADLIAACFKGYSSYYSFKVEIDSEYVYAKKAYELLDSISPKNVLYAEILMRYAYAYKVKFRDEKNGFKKCYSQVWQYYNKALNTIDKIYLLPSYQKANVLHSIGNSYSDFIHSAQYKSKTERSTYFNKALDYYLKSLSVKSILNGQKNSDYAVSCYTIALLHQSYNDTINSLKWYDRGIACINDKEYDLLHLKGDERLNTIDPYLLNILISNRNLIYYGQLKRNYNTSLLKKTHAANLERIILWRQIFSSYQSKDLGSVIALWNHSPFEEAIQTAYQLYLATKDESYLSDIFEFAEESKNNDYNRELALKKNTHQKIGETLSSTIKLDFVKQLCSKNNFAFLEIVSNKEFGDSSFLIAVDEKQIYIYPFATKMADSLLQNLKLSMKNNNCKAYENYAWSVYRLIFENTLNNISSVKKLVICPTGIFNDLPFEALVNKKRNDNTNDFRKLNYLLFDYSISYALSASILNSQMNCGKTISKNITAYYASNTDKADLLFSKPLFDRISKNYEGKYFQGKEASVNSFLKYGRDQQVLQIFSHARADKSNYENSSLYLFDAANEGLTLSTIYNQTLKSDLTILACCESGSGLEKYGEGVKSLVRGFTYSGSKSVIGTLWSVDEKSSISILDYFYSFLDESGNISTSLISAKQKWINECKTSETANPFYWAGIVASGDVSEDNKIEFNSTLNTYYFIVQMGLLVFALIFIFLYLKRLGKI